MITLIQATFKMYRQKCRWKKFKNGIIALQRLVRRRQRRKNIVDTQKHEEKRFLEQLGMVESRRMDMERRYKMLARLHPNRVNSFLGVFLHPYLVFML